MKATLETSIFRAALASGGVAAGSRSTLPILGSVLLVAADDQLTISSTDLDLFVRERCAASVKEPGSAVVAFKTLSAFVNRANATQIKLHLDGNELRLKCGDAVAVFETLLPSDFPEQFAVDGVAVIECSAEELLKPLRMVQHAIGDEAHKYVLTGVCFRSGKKGIEIATSDDRQLAIVRTDLPSADLDAILPGCAVRVILRNVTSDKVRLEIGSGSFALISGEGDIRGRLIEGQFVNYSRLISERNGHAAFTARREELLHSITTAALFLPPGGIAVALTGKDKLVEVSCEGKFRETLLPSELDPPPQRVIQFNHRCMRDTLNAIDAETVRIEHDTDRNTAVIRHENFIGLIRLLELV